MPSQAIPSEAVALQGDDLRACVYLTRLAQAQRESVGLPGNLDKHQAEWEHDRKRACAESMQKPNRDLRRVGEPVRVLPPAG